MHKTRIALIETSGEDFYMSRMPLCIFLEAHEYDVFAIVPEGEYSKKISDAGVQIKTYYLERNNINPFKFIKSIVSLKNIIRDNKIDIVHTFRLQPNIIGTVAAKLAKVNYILNHITGLGISFSSNSPRSIFFRISTIILYNLVFSLSKYVIFQNPDDIITFRKFILHNRKKIQLIKGSGIDCEKYSPDSYNKEEVSRIEKELELESNHLVITLISRLIWHKGIHEFVMAAKNLNKIYSNLKFLVVGCVDNGNPLSVDDIYIKSHDTDVTFLGKRTEIKSLLHLTDIFVLPSYYREGIPRAILEAMAMAKPIVTTTMPGCNLTVTENQNGFLIKPRDSDELMCSLEKFITDTKLIKQFGNISRQKALEDFSEKVIFQQISELYIKMIDKTENDI